MKRLLLACAAVALGTVFVLTSAGCGGGGGGGGGGAGGGAGGGGPPCVDATASSKVWTSQADSKPLKVAGKIVRTDVQGVGVQFDEALRT